jgi:hypothetical protein
MASFKQLNPLAQPAPPLKSPADCSSSAPILQLTRLNYQASDAVQAQALVGTPHVTATYDLVSIEPSSERVLQQVSAPASCYWRNLAQASGSCRRAHP